MEVAYLESPLGTVQIKGDRNGVTSIFTTDRACPDQEVPGALKTAVNQLKAYFNRERKNFTLKLDLQGTEFQKKVWSLLLEIPYGKTITYLDLAKKMGNPSAVRAVAAANAKNPLWIVVPCHRVIGTNGSLTGYAGGLSQKKWLLEHEQASVQHKLKF